MNPMELVRGAAGGLLIGLSISALLLLNGRVAGIAGIVGGALNPLPGDRGWRIEFLAGLLAGGLVLLAIQPQAFGPSAGRSLPVMLGAGLLVGIGTRMGSGCTSGHGVCGNARFSPRSIVATVTFILVGALTVYAFNTLGFNTVVFNSTGGRP